MHIRKHEQVPHLDHILAPDVREGHPGILLPFVAFSGGLVELRGGPVSAWQSRVVVQVQPGRAEWWSRLSLAEPHGGPG